MPLYLDETRAKDSLSMPDIVEAVRNMFLGQYRGEVRNVPRTRAPIFDRSLNVTAATDIITGRYAVKVYGAGGFHILLYSRGEGLLAIMEADWLGQLRTGAATGVATQLLARPNSRKVGLIGAGRQARCQLLALQAIGMMNEVRVFARDQATRENFCSQMVGLLSCCIRAVDSAEAAVSEADIVVTATNSTTPVLQRAWLLPGVHVNGMGANAAGRSELDPQIVADAETVATDDPSQARAEAGEFITLDKAGRMDWGRINPLGRLLAEGAPVRSSTGITVFKSLGCGLEDLAIASLFFDQISGDGSARS